MNKKSIIFAGFLLLLILHLVPCYWLHILIIIFVYLSWAAFECQIKISTHKSNTNTIDRMAITTSSTLTAPHFLCTSFFNSSSLHRSHSRSPELSPDFKIGRTSSVKKKMNGIRLCARKRKMEASNASNAITSIVMQTYPFNDLKKWQKFPFGLVEANICSKRNKLSSMINNEFKLTLWTFATRVNQTEKKKKKKMWMCLEMTPLSPSVCKHQIQTILRILFIFDVEQFFWLGLVFADTHFSLILLIFSFFGNQNRLENDVYFAIVDAL